MLHAQPEGPHISKQVEVKSSDGKSTVAYLRRRDALQRVESSKACWCGIAEGHDSEYDAIRLFEVAPRGFMNKWKKRPSGNYLGEEFPVTRHDAALRGEMVLQLV